MSETVKLRAVGSREKEKEEEEGGDRVSLFFRRFTARIGQRAEEATTLSTPCLTLPSLSPPQTPHRRARQPFLNLDAEAASSSLLP